MAMMTSWVELVNPSHLYLENDQLRRLTRTICAFHLGFSLVFRVCHYHRGGTRRFDYRARTTVDRSERKPGRRNAGNDGRATGANHCRM